MSRVQFVRQMLPRICKDYHELEIYHNPTGAATFDPQITTSVSTTVIWETEAGRTVTTGTTHGLSYTPTAGPKKCTITVRGGLGLVTEFVADSDEIVSMSINKLRALTRLHTELNTAYVGPLSTLPKQLPYIHLGGCTALTGSLNDITSIATQIHTHDCPFVTGSINNLSQFLTDVYISNCILLTGSIDNIPSTVTFWYCENDNLLTGSIDALPVGLLYLHLSSIPLLTGSIANLPSGLLIGTFYNDILITAGSIAHLIDINDLRIHSMGWTAQQNTGVLLSAWGARANYTYASGIALRISAPTGTPGTEPPEEDGPGHDTADWAWDAGTSRYDPLTGYAVIADLQTDFYSEGFKHWVVTIV